MKPKNTKPPRTANVLVLQSAEGEHAANDGSCYRKAGEHVTEVAAEETVAVFELDAFREPVADLGNRFAMSVADDGQATLSVHPIEDHTFANRQPARRFLADRLHVSVPLAVIEA